jgi:BirA family transcriptional regulator, biotin operon repressor / biotin---[acetyl-CoA-carboxylase] ligase
MRIIKLNAIDSTNTYLKQICDGEMLKDYTIVITKYQTHGRGQMGTVWSSEKAKNLMCSVFKEASHISVDQQFYISIVTSLAIVKALRSFNIPKLNVKWPNDILSESKKVCGILIENVIKNNRLEYSIIGIGLNVNQTEFKHLPNASSLKTLTGTVYNLDELLQLILFNLRYYFKFLEQGKQEFLKKEYENLLFRKDKPSSFKDQKGNIFAGFIKGINAAGNLQILLEDDILKEYDLKEVQLLY